MKKPIDIAQSPKARSRSTTMLLIQAMIPVPNEAMISIKVQFPELNIAFSADAMKTNGCNTSSQEESGRNQTSIPLRIQIVTMNPT